MRYTTLGKTNLKVPVITLGTWVLGGMMWGPVEDKKGISAIHAALDNGITMIDTAPVYGWGHSESLVGHAIHHYEKSDHAKQNRQYNRIQK